MGYRMNVGNELAQIKKCKTVDEINDFLINHNLEFDHWYLNYDTCQSTEDQKGLYVVANYQDINGTFIQITFNF
jgi:hypothetical protein